MRAAGTRVHRRVSSGPPDPPGGPRVGRAFRRRALTGLFLPILFALSAALPPGACVSSDYEGWTIEDNMAGKVHEYRSDLGTVSFVYDPKTERVSGVFDMDLYRFPLVVSGTIRNPVTMNVVEAALDQDGTPLPLEIPAGGNIVSFREGGTVALPGFQVVIDGHVRTILGTWEIVATHEVTTE
jgi:hypothetical protein